MKSKQNAPSNVSDFLDLVVRVYHDATAKCVADVSDERDLKTIRSRVEHEGLSFLTITLPQFAKDFERSLAAGAIDSSLFRGFPRLLKRRGAVLSRWAIPAFLQGMLSQMFDIETGELQDETQDFSTIVEAVRQVCCLFKKVEIECTPARVHAAVESFVGIEHEFSSYSCTEEDSALFLQTSSMLWDGLFSDFSVDNLLPRHGPGATAERISGNSKYNWRRWHDRLEPYFHLTGDAYPLGVCAAGEDDDGNVFVPEEMLEMVTIVPEQLEQPVRVVAVPKTLKSPRIIAIEPCCNQFAQQGLRDYLYSVLEKRYPTAGRINFSSQSINQRLALKASRTGRLATIDLSDASDRVPYALAREMFRSVPDLWDAIDACRSKFAQLPDKTIIGPLGKFASMGSALCFPVEAMYFYTICVSALMEAQSLSYTFRNVQKTARKVYVYGDDIVVPAAYATAVTAHLQKYNCKVNTAKSFWTGKFREFCGVDAYSGQEVTPTYLRQVRPRSRRQAKHIISWVATANQFYLKGYWSTAQFMFKQIERIIGSLPYGPERSAGLVRVSYLGYRSVQRWSDLLHRYEVKAMVPKPVYQEDELGGYAALSKCLGKLEAASRSSRRLDTLDEFSVVDESSLEPYLESVVSQDEKHLYRSALHGGVTLSSRWI